MEDPDADTIYISVSDDDGASWTAPVEWINEVDTISASKGIVIDNRAEDDENIAIYYNTTGVLKSHILGDVLGVDTLEADPVSETYATLNGEIVSLGIGSAAEVGFYWDTSPSLGNATGTLATWSETGTYSLGGFSHIITGLTEGESYYCIAYALNEWGEGWGSWVEFTAGATGDFAVVTGDPTEITDTTAIFNAEITEVPTSGAKVRGFQWGYTETPTWSWTETGTFAEGNYAYEDAELDADEIYYVRAIIGNDTVTDYGQWVGFLTLPLSAPPEVDEDTGLIPPNPEEPSGWIRPPKDWGEIGLGDAKIPMTFFVFIVLVGFVVMIGLALTKYVRSLAVLFMVLGFIIGLLSFWPKGGYLDWWVLLPYILVGWALLTRQKDTPITE
jgi:hypothetical protein